MTEKCEHLSPNGILCSKNTGHSGLHTHYEDVDKGDGKAYFRVHEWNDDCETYLDKELGNSFSANYYTDNLETVVNIAVADAKRDLPKGTVFEIRARPRPDKDIRHDYGRIAPSLDEQAAKWGVAWYWRPAPKTLPQGFESRGLVQEPLFRMPVVKAEYVFGYLLIARIKNE